MEHPVGESDDGSLRVDFDRRLKLEFHAVSAAFVRWLMRPASNSATAAICVIRNFPAGPAGIAGRSRDVTPLSPESAADRDILALKARSHPRHDVRVGSGATRTKVLPKFSPRSISAKAVGMTSNPSRISSR